MSCGEFTDDEILQELAQLGYSDVPQDKLEEFKKDLMTLISKERTKSNSLNSSRSSNPEGEDKQSQQQTNQEYYVDEGFGIPEYLGHSRFNEDWRYNGEAGPVSRPQRAWSPWTDEDNTERNQSCHHDDVSQTSSETRFMKRKTSRKTPAGCRMIDESFTDTESGVFEIYEKIKNLAMRECACGKTRSKSGDVEPPYRFKGKINKHPSVIRKLEPPHTRNLVKTDVNERHKMYKEAWKTQPPIGEDHRIPLRKATHCRLMKHEEVQMKPKVYIPNIYVPPHQKLRKDVRWKVREAFEKYELPPHGFYHET